MFILLKCLIKLFLLENLSSMVRIRYVNFLIKKPSILILRDNLLCENRRLCMFLIALVNRVFEMSF